MENTSPNDPALALVSLLINKKLNDPNDPAEEKIVLPDECGDTLWDEVMEKNEKVLPVKDSIENENLTNSKSGLKK